MCEAVKVSVGGAGAGAGCQGGTAVAVTPTLLTPGQAQIKGPLGVHPSN